MYVPRRGRSPMDPGAMPPTFSAPRVIGRSLAIVLSNAGAFVLMTMLVNAPLVVFHIREAASLRSVDEIPKRLVSWMAVDLVAGAILQPLATASVTYGVLQQLRGKPAGFGACF